ncbi:unnamed protein product [Durusdinium trenchii]|uniref:RWD domain-containing protein n=1 Tax=Durusdinium trenchii TaxID=1381693 RepID=A0ABP0JLS8_9DINO
MCALNCFATKHMDEESVSRQAAEIEALQAIFADDFQLVDEAQEGRKVGASFRVQCQPLGPLLVCLPVDYPSSGCPSFTAERLRGTQAAQVQEGLAAIAKDLMGQECVFQVISAVPEVASEAGLKEYEEADSLQSGPFEEQGQRATAQGAQGAWASDTPEGTLLLLSVRSGQKVKTSKITNLSELRRVSNAGSICIDLASSKNTENYELANLLAASLQVKADDVEFLVGTRKEKAGDCKKALIRRLRVEEAVSRLLT